MEGASRRVSHGGCLLRMPVGKVPTEELFMEGTRSGGSYGEVSSQQDNRSKHYSSRSKHHNHNYTHYSPRCKYHNPNYTCYSPRCKYHSPRHTLSKEIECIADIFYQKFPTPCSRHRLFLKKRCIVDGNMATAPFLSTRHKVFLQKGCVADRHRSLTAKRLTVKEHLKSVYH